MSDTHEHEPLRQEEDRINTPFIIGVGVVSLAIFGVGILWMMAILKSTTGSFVNGTAPRPTEVGKKEIGIVFQPMFEGTDIAHDYEHPIVDRLNSYGWNDAQKTTAHIPVEAAMKIVIERGKL